VNLGAAARGGGAEHISKIISPGGPTAIGLFLFPGGRDFRGIVSHIAVPYTGATEITWRC
jgi:hypothetical protein